MKRKYVLPISGVAIIIIIIAIVIAFTYDGGRSANQHDALASDQVIDQEGVTVEDEDSLEQEPTGVNVEEDMPVEEVDSSQMIAFEHVRLEAEHAELVDLTVKKTWESFSGDGLVTGFTNDTGSVNFKVDVPSDTLYNLTIGFATPHGEKATHLLLNDEFIGEIHMDEVKGIAETMGGSLLLKKGSNTITLEKGWGWYDIDYIELELAENRFEHHVEKTLINPAASKEALALMSFLVDHYGKAILSGQQEYPNKNFVDVNYVKKHTGKLPAVLGLDFIDNSPSRVARGTSAKEAELAIDWYNNKGGIVAFTWHWNAPKDLIDEKGKEWYRGFYTEATTFDLQYALDHPDSEDYGLLLSDIDAIAVELKKLQDANVPILWRPLHEAEGGWFWWGAKGAEPAIALWKIMYDRLTHDHGLNNLIWVWNSVAEAWYPGDEYVDIVSYDSYPGAYNYTAVSAQFEQLMKLGQGKKLIAMAENGPIPDPELMQQYNAYWSWFSTWDGSVLREQNDTDHLHKVYNDPYVLTLEDLPDLKKYE